MTKVDDLRQKLTILGLETTGIKSALKSRLRKYIKKHPEASDILKAAGSNAELDEDAEEDGTENDSKDKQSVKTIKKERIHVAPVVVEEKSAVENPIEFASKNTRYDYYLCFDVEATCEEGFSFEFPNEIIEFPVVLLDGSTFEIIDEFHSYVRPVHRPILSDFCKSLTGITQETVDAAPTFIEVLELFNEFLMKHSIIVGEGSENESKIITKTQKKSNRHHNRRKNNHFNAKDPNHHQQANASNNDFNYGASFCFITDGPFDIRDFIGKQCLISEISRPSYFAKPYLDIRTMFREYFDLIHRQNLEGMLTFLGETFTGRQHSGICDARMVGLIAKRLALGFSIENEDPVFESVNKPMVSPQWSNEKIKKLAAGCVLKSNRTTEQTFIKMMSFKKLEILEALGKEEPEVDDQDLHQSENQTSNIEENYEGDDDGGKGSDQEVSECNIGSS